MARFKNGNLLRNNTRLISRTTDINSTEVKQNNFVSITPTAIDFNLPAATVGNFVEIFNTGTAGNLKVRSTTTAVIATIVPEKALGLVANGTSWKVIGKNDQNLFSKITTTGTNTITATKPDDKFKLGGDSSTTGLWVTSTPTTDILTINDKSIYTRYSIKREVTGNVQFKTADNLKMNGWKYTKTTSPATNTLSFPSPSFGASDSISSAEYWDTGTKQPDSGVWGGNFWRIGKEIINVKLILYNANSSYPMTCPDRKINGTFTVKFGPTSKSTTKNITHFQSWQPGGFSIKQNSSLTITTTITENISSTWSRDWASKMFHQRNGKDIKVQNFQGVYITKTGTSPTYNYSTVASTPLLNTVIISRNMGTSIEAIQRDELIRNG